MPIGKPTAGYRRVAKGWLETGPLSELAWAAGFFDGEGSVLKNGKLQVRQKDERPLLRFRTAIGSVGVIYGPYKSETYSCSKWYCQNISHAMSILNVLWPFLSEPKRDQARKVLGVTQIALRDQ